MTPNAIRPHPTLADSTEEAQENKARLASSKKTDSKKRKKREEKERHKIANLEQRRDAHAKDGRSTSPLTTRLSITLTIVF